MTTKTKAVPAIPTKIDIHPVSRIEGHAKITIHLDDDTLHASVTGDTLSLGEPTRLLAFRRVG